MEISFVPKICANALGGCTPIMNEAGFDTEGWCICYAVSIETVAIYVSWL